MAIAVGIYLGAGSFPGRHLGPAGPGFFPRLVAAGLFCLSAWGLLLRRTDAEGLRGQVSIPPRVLLGMGASVLYILLMYFVGYFPSTLLFVFVIMWLVRDGAPAWRLGAESAALTGFAFLVFRVIVKTYLPLGIFFE
jgi:uncharacterized membrane protein YGL010W